MLNPKQHRCLTYSDGLCSYQANTRAYTYCLGLPTCGNLRASMEPYGKGQCGSLQRVQKRAARWACQVIMKWDRVRFKCTITYDKCAQELGCTASKVAVKCSYKLISKSSRLSGL